ncbi:Ionotropic receptor 174 [Frankliniella occidentalis]|nr:Ionotropic receptor 174 [Frankliniella occidentalis]
MEAALVVLLLCCCCCCPAPGVRAGIPVEDLAVAPEARSAAALVTPFMKPQNATLVVLGDSRWTGAFLRELSGDVPRLLYLKPRHSFIAAKLDDDYSDYSNSNTQVNRLRLELMAIHCLLLVPTNDLEELLFIMRTYSNIGNTRVIRALFWTTVSTSVPRDKVLRRISQQKTWLGGYQHALAITFPDGSATLFKLTCSSDDACSRREMTILETDTWSPVDKRWSLATAVFSEFCSGFRRINKDQDLTMFIHTKNDLTNPSSLKELTKSVVNLVSRGRQPSESPVKYQEANKNEGLYVTLQECSLAAVLLDGCLLDVYKMSEISFITDMEMASFAVIVPAGLGASVGVLEAVTVEFSEALWLATGLATLCTVVVLKFARRQDVSGAVLQALAPMLGQAPPPPAPPRPMLAAWLLACVVLTAAYQGLLLGKLSSAVPRRDLDSLRDLEDSGLPLKVVVSLARRNVLSNNLTDRAEYVERTEVKTVIDTIATARNCALVTLLDRHTHSYMRPYMLPPKKLHVIRLRYYSFNVIALATKGSPLERPIAKVQGRVEAAGLLARWRRAEYERESQDDARRRLSLEGPRPLTLWQLQPAFVVLGVGQVTGVFVFALEALCAWRARWA